VNFMVALCSLVLVVLFAAELVSVFIALEPVLALVVAFAVVAVFEFGLTLDPALVSCLGGVVRETVFIELSTACLVAGAESALPGVAEPLPLESPLGAEEGWFSVAVVCPVRGELSLLTAASLELAF
jgi:hypothetical protein